MSDLASTDAIELAALGRPFSLGMLYDCRSEKQLHGITLWDNEVLDKKVVREHKSSDSQLVASNSLDDKAFALNINGNLKLSFLTGRVSVSGAAEYLNHTKSSTRQEQIILHYKCTTKTEQMTMDQLAKGKIQHHEVFEHGTATHVVTGIQYGAQSFFVFEREKTSSSDESGGEISGKLDIQENSMVKKILGNIGLGAQVKLSEDERKIINKFSCRFFGDFLPDENPSSFEEAIKLCRTIPQQLGHDGVPIKVWLYPLTF